MVTDAIAAGDGPHVIILAAGLGTRMGGPKAFRVHRGRTFLERILERCRESSSPITLVCDPDFRARLEAESGRFGSLALEWVEAAGKAPMLASVQAALNAAPPGAGAPWRGGFWLWPVDAPFISARGWETACDEVRGAAEEIWKLRAGGKTGHPIWFPEWSVAAIRVGDWPDGLLGFLASCPERVRILPLEGEFLFDVNTPEELARVPEGL